MKQSKRLIHISLLVVLTSLLPVSIQAQLSSRYTKDRPLVIVCDWDKPPYEFLNDRGLPAGSNIDVMDAILKQLNIPHKFIMKEWGNAIKTFERNEADLIFANVNRYQQKPYVITQNVINYNRIRVAMQSDTVLNIPLATLEQEGVVFKSADYSAQYFVNGNPARAAMIEYQSPKVALTGIVAGDNKYFVWGEEPLKWKIKELNLEGIKLCNVNIPISEIHIIGRDKELIEEIDDRYSRLKQSGEIERMNDRWFHPERADDDDLPITGYIIIGVLLLAFVLYLFNRLARARVQAVNQDSTDLNNMMYKALAMGNFNVMEYDIANDRFTNRYGHILPEKGLSLEQFTDRIHPEQRQEFGKKMQQLLGGREKHFELDKRWNAGTEEEPRWLTFHGHAIVEQDEHGRPAYVVNALHNITQEMEEDHAMRDLNKKYERLFNMPYVAMSFYNQGGWLVDLNDAMREICGFNNADADAERYWQTVCMFDVPLFRNAYSPDDRDDLIVCQHMEYPEIHLDRYIEFHIHPLIDDQGELIDYFISTIDITEQRNQAREIYLKEREIRETNKQIYRYERRLQYLLAHGNMYAWHLDFQKKDITYTRSLMTPEYVRTFQEYYDSVSEEDKPTALKGLETPEMWRHPFSLDRHFRKPLLGEGSDDRWYNVSGIPVLDEAGNITGTFGLLRDITDLIEAQERLKEERKRAEDSGRQKSMFLASMTHELRTPLNSIVGFSDLLGTVESPEERREFIRIIRNNCDMLLRLIDDIQEASSISDGPQSISPQDTDFAVAFDDICQNLSARVQDPAVQFIKENPYTSLLTRLDMGRIQQVATNFVTNAVKHTREGHIRVGYRYENEGLYLYCEDTGIGIPEDKLEAVFERFVKLDEFVQGTGLGLNICKSIAERFGGKIGVESEVGKGSTFWIWIPAKVTEFRKRE